MAADVSTALPTTQAGYFKDKDGNKLYTQNILFGIICRNTELEYDDGDTTWNSHTIPMQITWEWSGGSALLNTSDESSITIGTNVSLVEVSGCVTVSYLSKASAVEIGVNKNGSTTGIIGFGVKTEGWGNNNILYPANTT